MKIVLVKWVDSSCKYGWQDKENLPLELDVTTFGYLIDDNVDRIVIAQSIGDDCIQNPLAIPKECIKDFEVIK